MFRSTALFRFLVVLAAFGLLTLAGCGDDDATPTSSEAPATTAAPTTAAPTTAAPTTTTEPPTTTTEAPTTTTPEAPVMAAIGMETWAVGLLEPYNDGGGALFASDSVEAHLYQADGFYVILYRGWDATSGEPICAGNSVGTGSGWEFVSNSPFGGTAAELCVDVPKIADPPAGVYACGPLLYYATEIPVSQAGTVFATLEFNDGTGFVGQTTMIDTDPAVPEFAMG